MREASIIIADTDAGFVRRLDGCLRARLPFPVSIRSYTDRQALEASADKGEASALIVSEGMARELPLEDYPRAVLLDEGLGIAPTGQMELRRVNKYRKLSDLLQVVTELVLEAGGTMGGLREDSGARARSFAFFTPITRCLQTTAALTLGQLLAEQGHRVLFLGTEPFPGHSLAGAPGNDLAALLYYDDCDPEKTAFHVERAKTRIGALDVIAPAELGTTVPEVEAERWRELLRRLVERTDYGAIVVDFSVAVRGLLQLLNEFDRVLTIERSDPVSAGKLASYERTLKLSGFEEVGARSLRLTLPVFTRLPADPARYAEGELARFLRQVIREQGLAEGLTGGSGDGAA